MDITNFVLSGREKALIYGDYSTYRRQLSRRLHKSRRRLGITAKGRTRFSRPPATIAAADVQKQNHEYLRLILSTSERAWAHAMSIKAAHAADTKGVTGRTRSHVVSRLARASRIAHHLVAILSDTVASGATANDVLEARAYAALIDGTAAFEAQSWARCLDSYSVARVIYAAVASSDAAPAKTDTFKDLLAETIDPSIRYAAYRLKTPRTIPIPAIARDRFARAAPDLVDAVASLGPAVLRSAQSVPGRDDGTHDGQSASAPPVEADDHIPTTLSWRSRDVRIEDAAIGQAWAQVAAIKARLHQAVSAPPKSSRRRAAAGYDPILMAAQEAADATKRAIDELRAEGVSHNDARIQSLQITRTAVSFEMISWRIGRNRVLVGAHDGAPADSANTRRSSHPRPAAAAAAEPGSGPRERPPREDKPAARIVRLKEKVALYDGILLNLDAAKELPGIAADQPLSDMLAATAQYFVALRTLSIARSHAIVGNMVNALALINHGFNLSVMALPVLSTVAAPPQGTPPAPPNIHVTADSASFLHAVLQGELDRHRALVHLANLRAKPEPAAESPGPGNGPDSAIFLIDRLSEFPRGGQDLSRIVEYPPKLSLIPAKPIFLDLAWNQIAYPKLGSAGPPSGPGDHQSHQKRGWFGFGT